MAVIVCPHCKKYISSQLGVCPECGGDVSHLQTPVEEITNDAQVDGVLPEASVGEVQTATEVEATPDAVNDTISENEVETTIEAEAPSVEAESAPSIDAEVEPSTDADIAPGSDAIDETNTSSEEALPEADSEEVAPLEKPQTEASQEESQEEEPLADNSNEPQEAKAEEPTGQKTDDVSATNECIILPPTKKPWYALTARKVVTILFFLLLIGGITYFLIADHRRNAGYEKRAYERLEGCTNLLWYEDYIIRFPEGEHIEEVKKMYAVAQKEQNEFFKKAAGGDRDALQKFIKEHPSSPYVKVCENRIDSLDWDVALSTNNTASYQHYLELHPQGIFAPIASESKSRLAKLEITPEEKSMVNGSIDSFLSAMTSGDEGRVDALVSSPMRFCGESDATGANVVNFCKNNFQHDDIIGVHFQVAGGLSIKKKPSDAVSGAYDFVVNATLDAVLNRTHVDSTGVQVWKMTATLSPDRKFRSVEISRF